jgi:hypothetical protein
MKLHSLKNVKPQCGNDDDMDSVAYAKVNAPARALDVLMEAQTYWDNMSRYREERERNKRYTYGDQWGDLIHVDGCTMTEEKYIQSMGNVPLKNNLIRRLVRNVIGVYRSQSAEPVCTARDRDEQKVGETMSTVLQYVMQTNRMSEMYARTMEEYMIGALIVHKKWYGWRDGREDCWTDYVQPDRFFIDTNTRDFRGWDVSLVGEIHDVPFGELANEFATSPADYDRLANIYRAAHALKGMAMYREQFGTSRNRTHIDFLYCPDETLCRVIEVWKKETKPRYRCHDYNSGEVYKVEVKDYAEMVEAENARRKAQGLEAGMDEDDIPLIKAEWFVDNYWYFYYLSPMGDILAEGETPYEHKSHPYVFKAYPFLDGEIHSFVSDVIDQQRYTNRLITLYDWIMRASAKGVLLVPDECIPDSMDIDEFADAWTRFNGVVVYKAKPGIPAPAQVANNSTNIGINELLNLQLKFFEDISGVHGALQGRTANSSTSGTLYAQQAQNATTSLLDLLDSFSQFITDAAYKDVKNIQQFYDEKRITTIAGDGNKTIKGNAASVLDAEFDLSVSESQATPAFRDRTNQMLLQFWQSGQINLQQLLEVGDFPFADALLQNIQANAEEMQQGQAMQGVDPNVAQQAEQGADQDTVDRLYAAMKQNGGGYASVNTDDVADNAREYNNAINPEQ